MLHETTSRFSGEKWYIGKFWLILISSFLFSIQIIAQNGWTQVSTIPSPRDGATAAVVDGKIYLIGGWLKSSMTNTNINEMYDPSTKTWANKASMPTARGFLTSAVVDGIIYVFGGVWPTWTNKVEAYNPVTNAWESKANMSITRINARAAVINGLIYVVGGGYNERSCEYYNPQTNTWTLFKELPSDAGGISAVTAFNGLIYACGGGYNPSHNKVYAYDPQTDTWTKKSDMLGPRFIAQACLIYDKIFVIGGATADYNAEDAVDIYDPNVDTWFEGLPMPLPSAYLSCAVVNNKIYTFEGTSDWSTGGVRTWEYDPLLDSLVAPLIVPVELTSFTAAANGKEVTLNWSTATELNNQGFEVQRKFGSNDFVTVGSVKGNGTTTSPNQYSYVDKLVDPGKYFYRLKQIDYGGTFEYSNEIEVEVRVLDKFTLEQNYPNPFNPTTTIGYVLQERSNVKLILLNALGEEIEVLVNEEQDKGYHKVELKGSKLTSGVYFYQLMAGDFISVKKMVLLK